MAERKGPGMALAIMGLLVAALAAVTGYRLATGQVKLMGEQREMCQANLAAIANALHAYAADNNGRWPPSLRLLQDTYLVDAAGGCPDADGGGGYVYAPGASLHDEPMTLLVVDPKGNHRGGRNVAYLDGTVYWTPEREFQDRLKHPRNARMEKLLAEQEGGED